MRVKLANYIAVVLKEIENGILEAKFSDINAISPSEVEFDLNVSSSLEDDDAYVANARVFGEQGRVRFTVKIVTDTTENSDEQANLGG